MQNNRFKIRAVTLSVLFTIFFSINAAAKVDYYQLAKSGSFKEIKSAITANSGLINQKFGDNRATFLMLVLNCDRDLEIVNYCLKSGAKANDSTTDKITPLMFAAQYETHADVVERIISYGASSKSAKRKRILEKDSYGKTCLDYALLNAKLDTYSILAKYVNEEDLKGSSSDRSRTVSVTYDGENKQNTENSKNSSKSNTKAENQKDSKSDSKTDTRKDTKKENNTQSETVSETPAEKTAAEAVTENKTVTPAAEVVYDVSAKESDGFTLLMMAAKAGNDWDVKNLLSKGADVNAKDSDGWTALMYAVRYSNSLALVQSLIDAGADINVKNSYNATPLLLAADYSQNVQIIDLLLKNRRNTEAEVLNAFVLALSSTEGPVHVRKAKIQLFLNRGISVNLMWKGKTPLMYAARYTDDTEIIQYLLDCGAKKDITDEHGKTAFEYAKVNSSLKRDDIYRSLDPAN